MANQEHVEIVKRGAKAIHEWQDANPDTLLDLSRADLSKTYLSNANLSQANLLGADLSNANLSNADLSFSNLSEANLTYANLSKACLLMANLNHADLSYASSSNAGFEYAKLNGANLSNAILINVVIIDSNLEGTNLNGALLIRVRLIRSNLHNVLVEGCDVSDLQIEGLTGLPIPPKMLIRHGEEITGHEATTFFTSPALVEVYFTTELSDETFGAYHFHLGEIKKEGVGTTVSLQSHRHEAGGSVLVFQAPDYPSIYDILPDLLAPFPHAQAIDWEQSLNKVSEKEREAALKALVTLETYTPQHAWQFAERLAGVIPEFLHTQITAIRSMGNQVEAQEGFRLPISTDEQKLEEQMQGTSNRTVHITMNGGVVNLIQDQSSNVQAEQMINSSVGPNAQSSNNTYQQTWNELKDEVNLETLADELATLREDLTAIASEAEDFVAISEVAKAEKAAKEGNGPKALECLKKSGKWVFDKITKIGVGVTLALVKDKLGL